MADLPDYYTQAQISEAEAAKFKGGLDANKSDTPVSRDIYYATDSKILRICVVDGTWININALYLLLAGGTMSGNIAMGGKKVTGLGAGTVNTDAIQKQQAILQSLLTTQGDLAIRGESVAERLAKITTGQILEATATGYQGVAKPVPRTVATGTYTGDAQATRQITTGFICSLVLIQMSTHARVIFIYLNEPVAHGEEAPEHERGAFASLHASDGFNITTDVIVCWNNAHLNENLETYRYWAISE